MVDTVIDQARMILETTAARWESLTRHLPADLLTCQPTPGEWSAVECLQHIVDTEPVFRYRMQCLLEGKDFPGFDPDLPGDKIKCLAVGHRFWLPNSPCCAPKGLRVLATVKPADLDRTARHQELGIVTMSQLLHEWAAHDLNHTIQAERALMQPFIAGCGPWQSYFADHNIMK